MAGSTPVLEGEFGAGAPGTEQLIQSRKEWQTHTELWLGYWRDIPGLAAAGQQPTLSDWRIVGNDTVCFTVSAGVVLPLLVFETDFEGFFSDNMITVVPCLPRLVCFTYDGWAGGVGGRRRRAWGVDRLRTNIQSTSLADYIPQP